MRPVGWRYESVRHALAAKGIATRRYFLKMPLRISIGGVSGGSYLTPAEQRIAQVAEHQRKLRERDEAFLRSQGPLAKKIIWKVQQRYPLTPEELAASEELAESAKAAGIGAFSRLEPEENLGLLAESTEEMVRGPSVLRLTGPPEPGRTRSGENVEFMERRRQLKEMEDRVKDKTKYDFQRDIDRRASEMLGEAGRRVSNAEWMRWAMNRLNDITGHNAERVKRLERLEELRGKMDSSIAEPVLGRKRELFSEIEEAELKGLMARLKAEQIEAVELTRQLKERERSEVPVRTTEEQLRSSERDKGKEFLARKRDYIRGGMGDKRKISDFDKVWLRKGTKVEMEHTKNPKIAREIAMDHMTEFGADYYKELAKMEARLEAKKRRRVHAQ